MKPALEEKRNSKEASKGLFLQKEKYRIGLAEPSDKEQIYRIRHEVYAEELGQHQIRSEGRLKDSVDKENIYIAVWKNDKVAGFISITPPGSSRFSIEKYRSRADFKFPFDEKVFEVRLLTVQKEFRRLPIALLLMFASFRWVEANGGSRIIGMGKKEVMGLYRSIGMAPLGMPVKSGAVDFEIMAGSVETMRKWLDDHKNLMNELESRFEWALPIPFEKQNPCFHGGAFFESVGDDFKTLEKSSEVINADVLDAWFPPSPKVISAIHEYLPWLARTSPPTGCEGMVRVISRVRGVNPECVLPGGGSSDLIYLAFRHWLNRRSRVLILDPSYGEYSHVTEKVIGCQTDRVYLLKENQYDLASSLLREYLKFPYDLIVIVNPNSPTGRFVEPEALKEVLLEILEGTRVWVDETYIEYAGKEKSLERFAEKRKNVIICKSMSKVYGLSGMRAGYLVGPPSLIGGLRGINPPWAVSLPAQVAAVKALEDPGYYEARYRETHVLRGELEKGLEKIVEGITINPSVTNFLLCHLPDLAPDSGWVVDSCRKKGLYLRDPSTMSTSFENDAFRIAVKDRKTNKRMLKILSQTLGAAPCPFYPKRRFKK